MGANSLFVSAQYSAIIEDSRGIPQIGSGAVVPLCVRQDYHYLSIIFEVG
jgi:hypothetical protein